MANQESVENQLYYLQDKRTIVGNSISFWAINGRGYTCDVRCAQVWTKEELIKLNYWEENEFNTKYKPWPKEEIDRLVQFHVDHQDLRYKGEYGTKYPHTIRFHRPDLMRDKVEI